MKFKNIFLTVVTSSMVLFSGCNEEDFLTKVNPNTVTTGNFWKTKGDFEKGTTAIYATLQYPSLTGATASTVEEVRTDLGRSQIWFPASIAFNEFAWNDNTKYVVELWSNAYTGVFRANQVLQNIETVEAEDFTEDEKTLMKAQAKFLRGLYYFWISNAYNGAVMHTIVPETEEEMKKPFQDRAKIIQEIVIPDLTYAYENLPKTWNGDSNLGRVTWGAAASLLGKVYLYDKNWSEAAKYFKEVIDSDIYQLVPDIMDNFTDENEFNSESIFEVNYSDALKSGTPADIKDVAGDSEATARPMQFAPSKAGGWRTTLPTFWLQEAFMNEPLDLTHPINEDRNYSSRAYASIAFLDQDGPYYLSEERIQGTFANSSESAYVKKFTYWYKYATEDSQLRRSGINERIIRLADVYLMYAEAILMKEGDPALNEAMTYVDMVRNRAGVITLAQFDTDLGGRIPQMHLRKDDEGNFPTTLLNATSLMTHIQRVERPLELCFEGHAIRWNDLLRWGKIEEVFTELHAVDLTASPFTIPGGEVYSFDMALRNYTPDTHNYFPIPNIERTSNPNIGR